MTHPDRRAALLGLLVLLAVGWSLSVLHGMGRFTTGFFRLETGVSDAAFDLQLFFLVCGVGLLQVVPPRLAKLVAIAEGLACLAVLGSVAVFYVVALVAWFFLLELPLPRRVRPLLVIGLLVGTGLAARRWFQLEGILFSALFHVRLLVYGWDKWQRGYPRGSFVDFAFYLLVAPLVVLPPYVVIIPFYERHAASFAPRLTLERVRRACGPLGVGLLSELIYDAMPWRLPPSAGWLAAHYLDYVLLVLRISRVANVAYGLLLLHGLDERPPLRSPLLASDFVDLWGRYQTHQKDLQVAFFYTPVVIWLRRSNRYLAVIAATAFTLFFGNFAVHWIVRYVYGDQPLSAVITLYRFFAATFLLVAATLCLQEWRRRARRKPPRSILYNVACWLATQVLIAVVF